MDSSSSSSLPVVKMEEMAPPPPPAPSASASTPAATAAAVQPVAVVIPSVSNSSRRTLRPPAPPPPAPTASSASKVPLASVGQRRVTRNALAPQQRRPTAIRLVNRSGGSGSQGPRMGQTSHIFGDYNRDLESDPEEPLVFEEQFILRVPQEVLEGDKEHGVKGLAEMVKAKKEIEGVSIKFKDKRKAVFQHGHKTYAARLVDIPTHIEGHKTLDRKRLFKVADISQMLIVEHPIDNEASMLNETQAPNAHLWPHGLTPPLRWVKRRRWRKRQNNAREKRIEDEVDRLLAADEVSERCTLSMIDARPAEPETPSGPAETPREEDLLEGRQTREGTEALDSQYGDEDRSEMDGDDGRSTYAGTEASGGDDFDADLAAALAGFQEDGSEAEGEDEDGSSDDDDDEDELDEEDEELLNLKQQLRAYEQEVKDFEAVVEAATQSYNQANRLLKQHHWTKVQRAQQDLKARKEHVEQTQAEIDARVNAKSAAPQQEQERGPASGDEGAREAADGPAPAIDDEEDDLFGDDEDAEGEEDDAEGENDAEGGPTVEEGMQAIVATPQEVPTPESAAATPMDVDVAPSPAAAPLPELPIRAAAAPVPKHDFGFEIDEDEDDDDD